MPACLPACLLVLRIQPQAIHITSWCALDGEAGALLSFLDSLDAMLKRSGQEVRLMMMMIMTDNGEGLISFSVGRPPSPPCRNPWMQKCKNAVIAVIAGDVKFVLEGFLSNKNLRVTRKACFISQNRQVLRYLGTELTLLEVVQHL